MLKSLFGVDLYTPPAIVQKKQQEKLPYTVTDIGEGEDSLKAWKAQRKVIDDESYLDKKRGASEAAFNHEYTEEEKKALFDKLQAEADAIKSPKSKRYVDGIDSMPVPKPKKLSIKERIGNFILKTFNEAFYK